MYTSDPGTQVPDVKAIGAYAGVLWPGCNLTVYQTDDPRVKTMIDLCDRVFEAGVPQFGTCWGIQLPVFVAGGEVKANPKGREMGIGRKIRLTGRREEAPDDEGQARGVQPLREP